MGDSEDYPDAVPNRDFSRGPGLGAFTSAVWAAPTEAILSLGFSQGDPHDTLEFFVDGNSKVEGNLVAGAQATVGNWAHGGRDIAACIAVKPASGLHSH